MARCVDGEDTFTPHGVGNGFENVFNKEDYGDVEAGYRIVVSRCWKEQERMRSGTGYRNPPRRLLTS